MQLVWSIKQMKLHFLGRTYTHSQVHLKTIPSDCVACFRGQCYNLRVPVINNEAQHEISFSASIRKYRGVSYIVERKSSLPPKPREFAISK